MLVNKNNVSLRVEHPVSW